MASSTTHVNLMQKLIDQVEDLQRINQQCVQLVHELSPYRDKCVVLEQLNEKLRTEVKTLQACHDIEEDHRVKQAQMEEELQEIRQQLLSCHQSTSTTEKEARSRIDDANKRQRDCNKMLVQTKQTLAEEKERDQETIQELEQQIQELQNALKRKTEEAKEQRDRVAQLMNGNQVQELAQELGNKVDCFWMLIQTLRPFVRTTAAKSNAQMQEEEYIAFLQEQIVPQIEGCAEYLEAYLQNDDNDESTA